MAVFSTGLGFPSQVIKYLTPMVLNIFDQLSFAVSAKQKYNLGSMVLALQPNLFSLNGFFINW